MNTTQIGIDLAKFVFEVAISHTAGRVHERHRLSRTRFRRFLAAQPPAEILMEACSRPSSSETPLRNAGKESRYAC